MRIGVNLLGSFLTDFRNSRGKFDEIKEEFVINPAPIPLELSLNEEGSRWTKDLPRNSLNSFTNRSKLEVSKGVHGFLKRKLGLESWVIERVVRAVFKRRGSGFPCMALWLQIRGEGAWISLRKGHEFRHDRATIAPRSGHNLCLGRSSVGVRSFGGDSAAEAPRSRLDRAAIAVRSNRDRRVLPLALRTVWSIFRLLDDRDSSDSVYPDHKESSPPAVRWIRDHSAMKIGRSWGHHVAID